MVKVIPISWSYPIEKHSAANLEPIDLRFWTPGILAQLLIPIQPVTHLTPSKWRSSTRASRLVATSMAHRAICAPESPQFCSLFRRSNCKPQPFGVVDPLKNRFNGYCTLHIRCQKSRTCPESNGLTLAIKGSPRCASNIIKYHYEPHKPTYPFIQKKLVQDPKQCSGCGQVTLCQLGKFGCQKLQGLRSLHLLGALVDLRYTGGFFSGRFSRFFNVFDGYVGRKSWSLESVLLWKPETSSILKVNEMSFA